jgi:hypothetical protein
LIEFRLAEISLDILLGIKGDTFPLPGEVILFSGVCDLRLLGSIWTSLLDEILRLVEIPGETVSHFGGSVSQMIEMLPASLALKGVAQPSRVLPLV